MMVPPDSGSRLAPPGISKARQSQLSEKAAKASIVSQKKMLKRRPTQPTITPLPISGKTPSNARKTDAALRRSAVSPAALTTSKKGKPPSKKPLPAAPKLGTPSKRQSVVTAATAKKRLSEVKASPARPSRTSSKPTIEQRASSAVKKAPKPSVKGLPSSKGTSATKKAKAVKVIKRALRDDDDSGLEEDDDFASPHGELEDDHEREELTARNVVGELLAQSQDASTRYLAGATPGPKYTDGSSASKLSKSSSRFVAPTEKRRFELE